MGVTVAHTYFRECNCDDIHGPSGSGFDSECNWLRCLDFDLSTRSQDGHELPAAEASSDLIATVLKVKVY